MACYTPLKAYRTRDGTGDYGITFNENDPNIIYNQKLPCGKCIGCRLDRSRTWAIRCVHEAQMYKQNCFITLTYNPENLPSGGTLEHRDVQNFMKRLRKMLGHSDRNKVKYYMCGEYGEKNKRPHYHLCLFNYDFPDREYWKSGKKGDKLYTSKILQKLWQDKGYCIIGDVTFESAAYVARYITKKITGPMAKNHYGDLKPEYNTCSNGIGRSWIEKYHGDVYPSDQVVCSGKDKIFITRPARYYDKIYEKLNPEEYDFIKQRREEAAFLQENNEDNKPERLLCRYKVKLLNMKTLKRSYEFDGDLDMSLTENYSSDTDVISHLNNY